MLVAKSRDGWDLTVSENLISAEQRSKKEIWKKIRNLQYPLKI